MGMNKQLRKKIAGNKRQVAKHEDKIAEELMKPSPDFDLIAKWEKDILIFRNEVAKLSKKLPGGQR